MKTKTPWDTLWINANLATFENNGNAYGAVLQGAIAVAQGKIAWIGLQSELKQPYEALASKVYSAENNWITPGLIDCHTHLVYAGNRAREFELRLQGATYEEIARSGGGIRATMRATREADEKSLFAQSAARLKALIAEGVTTVEIKSGYGLTLESEVKILNVAKQLGEHFPVTVQKTFLGAHTLPDEFLHCPADYINWLCDTALPYIKTHQLADAVDAFCEHIGFSFDDVERLFKQAKSLGLPVKLHADQLSNSKGGLLAAKYQALSADHLEYVDEESLVEIKKAGTVAVLLPAAYYYLRETHLPPIASLREKQIPIAIATDSNPGSAPAMSLLTTMNMACTLFKLTPEEVLLGVTAYAAKALGLDKTHGTLAVGKVADFVVWDIHAPAELAYWIGYNPCRHIIKSGKFTVLT